MRDLMRLVAKPFVLLAYSFREYRRYQKNFPIRWLSQGQLVLDDLTAHVDIEGKEAVDARFLEQMVTARDASTKTSAGYRTASIAITGYFLLAVLAIDMPISAFGVELKRVAGLNELLLICSSILGAFSAFHNSKTLTLETAINAAIVINHQPPLRTFYNAAYIQNSYANLFGPIYSPNLVWGKIKIRHAQFSAILALIFIFSILILMLAFRLYVTWWVWSSPSTDNWLLKGSIWLVPILDVGAAIFLMAYIIPLPHRDFFKLHQLQALEDAFPAAAADLSDQLYEEGSLDRMRLRAAGYLPPLRDE